VPRAQPTQPCGVGAWAPHRLLRRPLFALLVKESPHMLGQFGRKKFHGYRFRISAHHFIGGWDAGRFCVHGISPNLDFIIHLCLWLLPAHAMTFVKMLFKNNSALRWLSGPARNSAESRATR